MTRPAIIFLFALLSGCNFDPSMKYQNLYPTKDPTFLTFFRWKVFGVKDGNYEILIKDDSAVYKPSVAVPDYKSIAAPDPEKIQVTWIGHACFLIQFAGKNIITDPMFSRRASPVSFAGPERMVAPGIPFEKLPRIDYVVISHNHYDHLDAPTIERLGNKPQYFVPLGLKNWFNDKGISKVNELKWGDTLEFENFKFYCLSVHHFSSRSLWDRNETQWCGWIIEHNGTKIFFAGDTGYSPIFKEHGDKLGPVRLSLIPIGSYLPRWFMKAMHVDPGEAIKIHSDMQSETSIGMHWGTFRMGDEFPGEPPLLLKKFMKQAGLPEDDFTVMKFGETRLLRLKE